MDEKLLDFVVIGASKSGTTSLFHHLRSHPEITIPPGKDAPFFAQDDTTRSAWATFAPVHFKGAKDDHLWGTVTPRYMEHSESAHRLHALMPTVRIVAILRNPIDRAYSQYRQQVRQGKEDREFSTIVNALTETEGSARLRVLDPPALATEDSYLVHGEYARILGTYLQVFPASQLHVEFTEELESNPLACIRRVLAHIGAEDSFVPPNLGERYHRGGSQQRFPWLIPGATSLAPVKALWHRIPLAKRQAVLRWFFTSANVKSAAPPEIDSETRRRLAMFFRSEVDQLALIAHRTVPWSEFS